MLNNEQQQISHGERAHALLSASGASRWINCTPSARLEEENCPERKSSVFAEEGTLAHEMSEAILRLEHGIISEEAYTVEIERIMSNDLFSDEMPDFVQIYVDYCNEQFATAKIETPDAIIEIEQKLDLTEYIPESFGTNDCIIIANGIMEVIDLKYGKGVPVYAEENSQLKVYGLGAYLKYSALYDIETVMLTIVQPRINNISSWSISVDDLLNWADTELKVAAETAFKGEGELNAGHWCKFCGVKNRCRKLYDEAIEVAKKEFCAPHLLDENEISEMLVKGPLIIEWLNSLTEYAVTEANDGKQWPGFKLVEGRSRRKFIADSDEIASNIFERFPGVSEEDIYEMKLKSITALEKEIGKKKFTTLMEDMIITPPGKPTLVPLADKRPALGVGQAIADFAE